MVKQDSRNGSASTKLGKTIGRIPTPAVFPHSPKITVGSLQLRLMSKSDSSRLFIGTGSIGIWDALVNAVRRPHGFVKLPSLAPYFFLQINNINIEY